MSQTTDTNSDDWMEAPELIGILPPDVIDLWTQTRDRLVETARRFSWNRSEIARRSGVPSGTLYPWLDGTSKGRYDTVAERLRKWLDGVEEMSLAAAAVPTAPGFINTPTAGQVIETLLYAQMMPEMVIINLGAGMGKTMACEQFCDTRPHAYLITMRPTTGSVYGMLLELAQALGIQESNAVKLDRSLGDRLRRNGRHTLLIVDEAQNLVDQAVNQLRYFLDIYGVGIALVGNEELYGRFGGSKVNPAYAQLHRRIGKRLRKLQPTPVDIEMLIDAWGIEDEAVRRLCQAIGRKPGALSQITKTLQLAGMYAAGENRAISAADVKAAIANRGLEDH